MRALLLAAALLPSGWTHVRTGPDGGAVWIGRIPNRVVAWDHRASAVYLPPGFDPTKRYPVVYLLHGLRGAPSEFWDSLRLADVADGLISSGASPEGLCAGGFGAVDIGLRHPGLFGTLGSWEGYFASVFRDGPFVGAGKADLDAHDPALLVRAEAAELRRDGVRFYVSAGGNHVQILGKWTVDFADELRGLRLPYELWRLPPSERGHFWRATLPSALLYAVAGFKSQS